MLSGALFLLCLVRAIFQSFHDVMAVKMQIVMNIKVHTNLECTHTRMYHCAFSSSLIRIVVDNFRTEELIYVGYYHSEIICDLNTM